MVNKGILKHLNWYKDDSRIINACIIMDYIEFHETVLMDNEAGAGYITDDECNWVMIRIAELKDELKVLFDLS